MKFKNLRLFIKGFVTATLALTWCYAEVDEHQINALRRAISAGDTTRIEGLINDIYGGHLPSGNRVVLWGSDLPTFKLLESLGADVDARDSQGMGAFLIAAQNGEVDLVKYLISRGFSCDTKDFFGRTALHFAAGGVDAELAIVLIDCGSDVNSQNHKGMSPLMIAVLEGNVDAFEEFLRKGAMPELVDCSGKTVDDYLAMRPPPYVGTEKIDAMHLLLNRHRSKADAGSGQGVRMQTSNNKAEGPDDRQGQSVGISP